MAVSHALIVISPTQLKLATVLVGINFGGMFACAPVITGELFGHAHFGVSNTQQQHPFCVSKDSPLVLFSVRLRTFTHSSSFLIVGASRLLLVESHTVSQSLPHAWSIAPLQAPFHFTPHQVVYWS
jgi:hypothetical protein